jgi:hypothetical protein
MARQHPHARPENAKVGEPGSGAGNIGSGKLRDPGPTPNVSKEMLTGELSAASATLERIESLAVEAVSNDTAYFPRILEDLDNLKSGLGQVIHQLAEIVTSVDKDHDEGPTHYTPALFAMQAVKDGLRSHLSVRTVQKWLRDGLLRGEKANPKDEQSEWLIPAEEYLAFKKRAGRPRAKDES